MDRPIVGHHNRALALLLAGYAAGTLSAPLHALIAGHLAISPQHRLYVAHLESGQGVLVETARPVPLREHGRMLEAILSSRDAGIVLAPRAKDPILPPPLAGYAGCGFRDLAWDRFSPGVQRCGLGRPGGAEALLYRVRAGRVLPLRESCGAEAALVLHGAFSDRLRRYRRGDIAVIDIGMDDRPVADQDCIYLAVTDPPLHLTGPLERWIQRFFGSA